MGGFTRFCHETGSILRLLFAPVKKEPSPPPEPAEKAERVRETRLEKDLSPTVTLRRTIIDEVVTKEPPDR